MNRLRDPITADPPPHSDGYGEERVQDYLDHLCAPLVGVLPYSERFSLREEVSLHIEALREERRSEGASEKEALEWALREMGEPWFWGEAILAERDGAVGCSQPRLLSFRAVFHSLACFGPPTIACLLLVEQFALVPHQEAVLPYLGALALPGPFASGILAGITAPGRSRGGAASTAGLLGILSLVVGVLLLPRFDGVFFGLFYLLYWLPVGWIAESTAIRSVRQQRRMRFLRLAR